MKKTLFSILGSMLLLGLFVFASGIPVQGKRGDLEWGVQKGVRFTWEFKTVVYGDNYIEIFTGTPAGLPKDILKNGSIVEATFTKDFPSNYADYTTIFDYMEMRVDGKEPQYEENDIGVEFELEYRVGSILRNYRLSPPWFFPLEFDRGEDQLDLIDFLQSPYADGWKQVIADDELNGSVSLTEIQNDIVFEVTIEDLEVGHSRKDYRAFKLLMTYESRTGVFRNYHFDLTDTMTFALERVPNQDDGGFLELAAPLLPMIVAFTLMSCGLFYSRKKLIQK